MYRRQLLVVEAAGCKRRARRLNILSLLLLLQINVVVILGIYFYGLLALELVFQLPRLLLVLSGLRKMVQ